MNMYFQLELPDYIVSLTFNFFLELRRSFRRLHHFTFPLTENKGSNFSTSLLTLVTVQIFDYSHLSESAVISHYDFDLHFLNDKCP